MECYVNYFPYWLHDNIQTDAKNSIHYSQEWTQIWKIL